MTILQTRIFVPSREPREDWAETLLGKVICDFTQQFKDHLPWYWFSRYISPLEDSADCDISKIPQEYKLPFQEGGSPRHRSLRFRFEICDSKEDAGKQRLEQLIVAHSYAISDIRHYDMVADAGNNRFLGVENRQSNRNVQRAHLVTRFYHSTSLLMLDALVEEHGRFRLEYNDDLQENPRGNSFQSLHHLFCNITAVPLDVLVGIRGHEFECGTVANPPGRRGGPNEFESVVPVPVRF